MTPIVEINKIFTLIIVYQTKKIMIAISELLMKG